MNHIFFNRRRIGVLWLCFVIGACGCERVPDVSLAEIFEVTPAVVEAGDTFVIKGKGFVRGPVQVTLEGMFDPKGLSPPEHRVLELSGVASDESVIAVKMDPEEMDRIALESKTFIGTLWVRFPTRIPNSPVRIEARLEKLQLEFHPTGNGVQSAARRTREGETILRQFGIVAALGEGKDEDLQVEEVLKNSIADQSGIEPGARLLSVDEVILTSVGDLAGMDIHEEHRFEFLSRGGTTRTVVAQLSGAESMQLDEFLSVLLTSLALGAFLSLMVPRFQRRHREQAVLSNPLSRVFRQAVITIPAILLPALIITWHLNVGGTMVLLGVGLVFLGVIVLYGDGNPLHRTAGLFAHGIPLVVIVLVGGVASSNFGLFEAVQSQGGSRWGLHAWSNPLMMMTTITALSLVWPRAMLGNAPGKAAMLGAWGFAIAAGSTLVIFCLGGWQVPGLTWQLTPSGVASIVAGTGVFALKTCLVLAIARAMVGADQLERRSASRGMLRVAFRSVLLVMLGGAAFAFEWSDIPGDLRFASQVISAGLFFTLVAAYLFSRMGRFRKIRGSAFSQLI